MGDEKGGPYKVVSKMVSAREAPHYSIVKQSGTDAFLQETVPNAGNGETARTVCNLMNKDWKRKQEEWARQQAEWAENAEREVTDDNAGEAASS